MAPSRYDWKIVDWDVKPQHNQPTNLEICLLYLCYLVYLRYWSSYINIVIYT